MTYDRVSCLPYRSLEAASDRAAPLIPLKLVSPRGFEDSVHRFFNKMAPLYSAPMPKRRRGTLNLNSSDSAQWPQKNQFGTIVVTKQ